MMITLEEKIQRTDLFTVEEALSLIEDLPTMSEDQKDDLEDIIDDYLVSSLELTKTHKKEIESELEKVDKNDTDTIEEIQQRNQAAAELINDVEATFKESGII